MFWLLGQWLYISLSLSLTKLSRGCTFNFGRMHIFRLHLYFHLIFWIWPHCLPVFVPSLLAPPGVCYALTCSARSLLRSEPVLPMFVMLWPVLPGVCYCLTCSVRGRYSLTARLFVLLWALLPGCLFCSELCCPVFVTVWPALSVFVTLWLPGCVFCSELGCPVFVMSVSALPGVCYALTRATHVC